MFFIKKIFKKDIDFRGDISLFLWILIKKNPLDIDFRGEIGLFLSLCYLRGGTYFTWRSFNFVGMCLFIATSVSNMLPTSLFRAKQESVHSLNFTDQFIHTSKTNSLFTFLVIRLKGIPLLPPCKNKDEQISNLHILFGLFSMTQSELI